MFPPSCWAFVNQSHPGMPGWKAPARLQLVTGSGNKDERLSHGATGCLPKVSLRIADWIDRRRDSGAGMAEHHVFTTIATLVECAPKGQFRGPDARQRTIGCLAGRDRRFATAFEQT